ncbi:hypothetical protein CCR75_004489 [Bremia lactucae]|uniref:Protein BCP1 n=1 Tax=Bremia lactucae TaxID=4779 RepID=A0A976IE10_BRELC|nr:hypothetical protein CCR75_004489 [Bremia lactucae]
MNGAVLAYSSMPLQKKRTRCSGEAHGDSKAFESENDDTKTMGEDMESSGSENDLSFAPNDGDANDDDSDDDMNGGEAFESISNRIVDVDFLFLDPRESHYHSVKQFLLAYLPPSQPLDVSGLANAIVRQVTVGTMVCAEGEDDIYGFVTTLNMKRYVTETSFQQILQYVTKKCPITELPKLQHILSTKNVGLLINERMINLPYQLIPPLHSALHEDIEWAFENEDTEELRDSFKLDYFLLLATCTEESSSNIGSKKGKKSKTAYEQMKFFHNFEDEFFEQEAELSFSFNASLAVHESVNKSSKTSVVMLIEREKHKAALASISAMINV